MAQSIPLIDKSDSFEQIRDQIASILATETAAQQALAIAATQDPEPYTFRVFLERFRPWDVFAGDDKTPVVNVWYDSSRYDESSSNLSTRQKAGPSRYHVDCYAYATAEDVDGGGHSPGDELASKRVHHVVKLVRNILMHDKYIQLGLGNIVWKRWIDSIQMFQPAIGDQPVQNVLACRITFEIDHNETIDLEDEKILEIINIKIHHEPDGQVIAELHYEE